MLKKAVVALLGVIAVFVAALLALDIAYFVHGSLEEFPTVEDHSKVRLVTALVAIFLGFFESILIALICCICGSDRRPQESRDKIEKFFKRPNVERSRRL